MFIQLSGRRIMTAAAVSIAFQLGALDARFATKTATAASANGPAESQLSTPGSQPPVAPIELKKRFSLALTSGDKVKITVYEKVELEEGKWAAEQSRARAQPTLQQRGELTGEYVVQDDGTITLPLLGAFSVTEASAEDIQEWITKAYSETIKRPSFVTVQVLERQPIYVLGLVKSAGVYKYAPHMTVLHAIALAGGYERQAVEPWQKLEGAREGGKLKKAADRVEKLLARQAVLETERDGSASSSMNKLKKLVGPEVAKELFGSEQMQRSPVVKARLARESSLKSAIGGLKLELEAVSNRRTMIDANAREQSNRLAQYRSLSSQGLMRRVAVAQASIDLSQVEERGQEVAAAVIQVQQRITNAEEDLKKLSAESLLEIQTEITSTDRELSEVASDQAASEGALQALQSNNGSAGKSGHPKVQFEIVRRTASVTTVVPAQGTTALLPGDLIQVRFAEGCNRSGEEACSELGQIMERGRQ